MELNFAAAINDPRIGGTAGIARLANASRPAASYLLATLLPPRALPTYEVTDGAMTVRTTMAGAVGMDSKYPEGGAIDFSLFRERTLKLAIQNTLSEEALRQIQQIAQQRFLNADASGGQAAVDTLAVDTVLNFTAKLLIQPHDDREEWLRGQALFTGAQVWDYNGIKVRVDYGIPSANKFATRTGTAAYGGTASGFWSDTRGARRILGASYQVSIARRETIEAVIYNDANAINVLDITGGRYTIQRYRGSLERPSTDARETMTLIEYNGEGEVPNPASANDATLPKTLKVPFVPLGVVGHFGSADRSRDFIPGEGATENPDNALALGYTHQAPTTENNGREGRWARVYTPEAMPMQLRGQSVENALPVVQSPGKIVIASTVLPS